MSLETLPHDPPDLQSHPLSHHAHHLQIHLPDHHYHP
jgi:hypothetical protein